MADTYTIRIDANPSSIVAANAAIGRADRNANRLAATLRRAFAFVGIGLAIAQFRSLSDQVININNRIRITTTTTAELNRVYGQLFRVAQDTRAALSDTVQVYSRMALSIRQFGLSNRDAINLTRSLNQAVAISGANFVEARAALIQFSQGVAAGALRGDELRSVLEQLPFVADVIATRFNATRGELRLLGEQGLLTTQEIFSAFEDAQDQIEALFANIRPTIDQSFGLINNALINYVRNSREATAISGAFAGSLQFVARNMNAIADATLAIAAIGGSAFLGNRLSSVVGAGVTAAVAGARSFRLGQARVASIRNQIEAYSRPDTNVPADLRQSREYQFRRGLNERHLRRAERVLAGRFTRSLLRASGALLRFIGPLGALIGLLVLVDREQRIRSAAGSTRLLSDRLDLTTRQNEEVLRGELPQTGQILRRPGESDERLLERLGERRRQERLDALRDRRTVLDAERTVLENEGVSLARTRAESPLTADPRGARLREEALEENRALVGQYTNAIEELDAAIRQVAGQTFTDFVEENERVAVSLNATARDIRDANENYESFAQEQAISQASLTRFGEQARIDNQLFRRSLRAVAEEGFDPLQDAIQEYIATGAGPLDEAGRRLIDQILEMDRAAATSSFGDFLAEQARTGTRSIELLEGELTDLADVAESFNDARSRLLFEESQVGASDRERGINRILGISTLDDEFAFNEREDAEQLRRLAGRQFDREQARRTNRGPRTTGELLSEFEREQAHRRELIGLTDSQVEVEERLFALQNSARQIDPAGLADSQVEAARRIIQSNQELADSYSMAQERARIFASATEDAITELVTTGSTDIRAFARTIFQELTRATVRSTIVPGIQNFLGGSGGFLGSLFGAATPAQFGFSGVVGGSGGPDSQLFAFSPGEHVEVTPAGQRRRRGGTTIVQNINLGNPTNASSIRRNRKIIQREAASLARSVA